MRERKPRNGVAKLYSGAAAAILNAGRIVLLRDGMNARVDSILKTAGVVRSTFYRHFTNLDAVIIELLIEENNQVTRQAIAKSEAGSPADRLADIAAHVVVTSDTQQIAKLVKSSGRSLEFSNVMLAMPDVMARLREPFRDILESGREQQVFRTDCGIDELAAWLHRNIYALGLIPPVAGRDLESVRGFMDLFVLPGILVRKPAQAGCTTETSLNAINQRLDRIEKSLAAK